MARILVCDDEEGIRAFVSEALRREGYDVVAAEDGAAGKKQLEAAGFDAVLTDLKMPQVDGMALLSHVQQTQPEVPVIILTAHGSVENAVEAMKRGAFDYLQKPISSPAELRLLVARALEHRRLRAVQARVKADEGLPKLTWGAASMRNVVDALVKVAATPATVLLQGESGTGKEVAARLIHAQSPRAEGPFVAVNCAALSEELLESELFGHERGAFTGAHAQRQGRIELAAGGTFFLDEVGELKPSLQAKLLRVLQEKTFERVGGTRKLEADVRWVAATNRDLRAMMQSGDFREDLYHRLAVFPIKLPPLRERREDIPHLVTQLLTEIGRDLGRPKLAMSQAALEKAQSASWPGNVRELRNALERAAILAGEAPIGPDQLVLDVAPGANTPTMNLGELERQAIIEALATHDGNRKLAAETLGIGVRTLYDKLKRYDIP